MEKDDVEFETHLEEYSAKSFYEHYKDNLPQMVMVTQGYLGEVGFETFDRGQVFRIETYSSQKRVVAMIISGEKGMYGLQGRQISIPADYDVKFNIIKHGKPKFGKSSSLEDIIGHKDLPIEVQFAGSCDQSVNIGGSERTSSLFTLRLLHTYDDFYLLGNAICYGNLYGTVTAVPAYLPDLRFSIVKTIKGYTDEQYNNFLSVTDQFVKEHIRFDPTYGNTDIALYSHDKDHEDESYSYISPCEYYNIEEILRTNKPKPTKQSKKEGGNVYEVFRMSTVSLGGFGNQAYDTMVIDQSNDNKIDDAQIQDVRKSLKPVGTGGVTTKKNDDEDEKRGLTTTENVKLLTKPISEDHNTSSTEKRQNTAPPIPSKPDTSVLKRAKAFESDGSKELKPPPAVPKRRSEFQPGQEPHGTNVGSLPQKCDPVNVGRAAPLPIQPVPAYVKSQPMASSTDISSITQQSRSSSSNVQQSLESDLRIDVKALTMEDVSDWLKKLKLDKYAEVFLENQVDGCLLMELDKQMLREDFGMREFDIMKLLKFAKSGYVPKTRGSNQ